MHLIFGTIEEKQATKNRRKHWRRYKSWPETVRRSDKKSLFNKNFLHRKNPNM